MEKRFLLLSVKGRFFFIMTLLFTLSLLLPASRSFNQAPIHLRIASHSLGSSMYLIGAGVAGALRKRLPPGSTLDVLPYAGGVGNAKLVGQGGAEIGLGVNLTNKWAYEGKFGYDTKFQNLRALAGGHDTGWLCIMAHPKFPLNSFDEIKGKKYPFRLMILPPGSMGRAGAYQLLEAYGITVSDLKAWGGSVTETSFEVIVSAFQDGRIDCFIHVPTPGNPTVTELATTTGIKFLPIKEEVVKQMSAFGWAPSFMPAGTWKGVDKDVPLVGWWTDIICTKDLPDDIAYLVTKIILEEKDEVAKIYPDFKKYLDPKTAWIDEKNRIPLHPGAIRYYKEKNYMP